MAQQQSLACAGGGDIKQLPFLFDLLVSVGIVRLLAKDVGWWEHIVVAADDPDCFELQALRAMHRTDRNVLYRRRRFVAQLMWDETQFSKCGLNALPQDRLGARKDANLAGSVPVGLKATHPVGKARDLHVYRSVGYDGGLAAVQERHCPTLGFRALALINLGK